MKPSVEYVFAIQNNFLIRFPRLAIRRIGQHEVKAHPGKFICGQSRAIFDIGRVVVLDHHVGLTDGIRLAVDLLAVQVNIVAGLRSSDQVGDEILRFGQHTARTTRAIVDSNDWWQLVFDRLEQHMDHELNDFTRGKVLASLFVVFFVKFADQLFKHITHAQIGQWSQLAAIWICRFMGAEVDTLGGKLFQNVEQHISLDHAFDLVAQLKLVDDLFHIVAKAIEIGFEVGFQNLAII